MVIDWVETAPTPERTNGQDAPTANALVATGTFPVASNGSYTFGVGLSAATRQTYTITVKAKDQADNTGSAITTFVIR